MKISDIPVPTKRVMNKLAFDIIDKIQEDASKGRFQNGRSGYQYSNKGAKVGFRTIKGRAVNIDSYKNRKAAGMRYPNGQRVKGFENQATNTQTAFVDMNLTKRTLRTMRPSAKKNTAIVTYDRGQIVLANAKRGYDIYDLSDKNKKFIAERFGKELLDKNIKKYVSKTTTIK